MADDAKTPETKTRKTPNRINSFRKQLKAFVEGSDLNTADSIGDLLEEVEAAFHKYAEETLGK